MARVPNAFTIRAAESEIYARRRIAAHGLMNARLQARKKPRRSGALSGRSGALAYCARGASGAGCGVVAFGLAGSGDAGGVGARSLRPVVSVAGFVAVLGRSPLIVNTRNPATSTAPTIAGTTQAGLASIRGLSSIRGLASMFRRAMSSFGSFIVICQFLSILSSKRLKRPVAESVPVNEPHVASST
jgi:hypothetical protein